MKSKVMILIKNGYETNTSDFIEVIQMFLFNDVKIHLTIAEAEGVIDDYYKNKKFEVEILNTKNRRRSLLEALKSVIRNNKIICDICCYLVSFIENIIFMWKYKNARNKKVFVTNSFLTPKMRMYVPKESYDFVWVHDEKGLLWAEYIKKVHNLQCSVVYHCVELYWEHFLCQKKRKINYYSQYALFEYARKILMNTDLIVIQDKDRWDVLCRYTGAFEKKHVFFPVSMYDYNLKIEKYNTISKIIYYPTMIAEKRRCLELIKIFKYIKMKDLELEIHGIHADPGYLKLLKKEKLSDKIVLSNSAMSYEDLIKKHREIWCVFIYYGEGDNNDKYVVNSSNKIAMALQAGKPIISIGNYRISKMCKKYGCGIALKEWDVKEFKNAVKLLNNNYENFCRQARRCYEAKYNASNYYKDVLKGMMEVKDD